MYLKKKKRVRGGGAEGISSSEELKTEQEWKNIQTNYLLAPGRKELSNTSHGLVISN